MTGTTKGLDILRNAAPQGHVSELAAKDLVGLFGVPTPRRAHAADRDEAIRAFSAMRAPVAVKIISSTLHKSDIGGVELGIASIADVERAIANIERAAAAAHVEVRGFLVEEMAPPGIELLVGGVIDPTFGPAVMLGMGGIFAEILNDASARICPIDKADAMAMVHELKAAPLLLGARGRPAVDLDALAEIVVALGGDDGLMMQHANRVREVDLNPVIVSAIGAMAVDARVILRD